MSKMGCFAAVVKHCAVAIIRSFRSFTRPTRRHDCVRGDRRAWQCYSKGRSLSGHRFDLNGAPQHLGKAFCDVESEADAAVLPRLRAIRLAEFLEDDREFLIRDADAGI